MALEDAVCSGDCTTPAASSDWVRNDILSGKTQDFYRSLDWIYGYGRAA